MTNSHDVGRSNRKVGVGIQALGLVAIVGGLVGCPSSTVPTGFAAGERWAIPLIGPLEDGLLLVPAWVNDKGPFVFALDPDANVSIVDTDLVTATGARRGDGPSLLDESNTPRDRVYAEIVEWDFGMLSVKNKPAEIVPAHTFDIEGRRIHGVIGRDILLDSFVLGIDRDRGMVTLTTKDTFKVLPDDQVIAFTPLPSQIANAEVQPISRKLVEVTIDGERFHVHLDLGATASQLRAGSWTPAKLTETPIDGAVVDEVGTARKVTRQGIADAVTLGAVTTHGVPFIPYEDRRWPAEGAVDGTLGLSFFKPYKVTVAWGGRLYLRQRDQVGDVLARINRWQSRTLSGCERAGCVKITLIDPLATMPEATRPATHPGVVVSVAREPDAVLLDLDVLVAVTAADGKTPLKWLIVNMPAGTERTLGHLSADYVGATTAVLDASPFPRPCPAPGGCIDLLTPPQPFVVSTLPAR